MLVTHPSSLYYAEAKSWNETNFILPDVIGRLIKKLILIDEKVFACTCKQVHAVVILGRLEKYEKIKNLVFHQSDFSTLVEDTALFDSTFKQDITKFDDQTKYDEVLKYLLNKKVIFGRLEQFRDLSQKQMKVWKSDLFNWVALEKSNSFHKVFQFMIDFGFPVKNLAAIDPDKPYIIFKNLLPCPEKAIKLIRSGTNLEDCKKVVEREKNYLQKGCEGALDPLKQLIRNEKLEKITNTGNYIENFQKQRQLEREAGNLLSNDLLKKSYN